MTACNRSHGVVTGSGAALLARVVGIDTGTAVQVADVSSASVEVTNTETQAITYSATLAVADVLSDTLETAPRWTADGIGANVAVSIPGSAWSVAGDYEIRLTLDGPAGSPIVVRWRVEAG